MIKDSKGNTYYKLALHIHSTLSDGKRTPAEIAEEYKTDGYDAIALFIRKLGFEEYKSQTRMLLPVKKF